MNTSEANTLKYWLALLRAPGIGAAYFSQLLEHFQSPQEIFESGPGAIEKIIRLADNTKSYIKNPDWNAVEMDILWAEQSDNGILTLQNPHYPELLREIHDPPPLLFYHGDPSLLQFPQLAIVGSRNPSHAGEQNSYNFANYLSKAGFCITSGMALGVDAAAHRGALSASGLTIAVAGTGLDRVYPARHRELAHNISQNGLLVSEFVPGSGPLANHFPRRNRIISGLSVGTLVVEAAQQSGSLITARLAMEQGREVFAIPGSIHNPLARGNHVLIRQGAKLVETAQHILEEIGPLVKLSQKNWLNSATAPNDTNNTVANQEVNENLPTDQHRRLYAQLGHEPASIDTLVERSQLTAEAVSAMLVELELKGCVTSNSGMYLRAF